MTVAAGEANEDARPRVGVSVFNLGEIGGRATVEETVAQVGKWANAVPVESGRWDEVPATCPPDGWVSIVVCGFKTPVGEQQRRADVFAFLFDAGDGAVNAVAHRYYGMQFNWNAQSWYWAVPIVPLCSELRHAWESRRDMAPRDPLRVSVTRKAEEEPAMSGAKNLGVGGVSPRLEARTAMPQIAAMTLAAAAEAGWRAKLADAAPELRLDVELEYLAASLALHRGQRDGRLWCVRDVPVQALAAQLAREFFMVATDGAVFAVARAGAHSVLSGQGGALCVGLAPGAALLSGAAGKEIWSRGKDAKGRAAQSYTSRPGATGAPDVYQYAPELAAVSLTDGAATVLGPVGARHAWGFDVDGRVAVVADGSALVLCRSGEVVWRQAEETPIEGGPRLTGACVLAGTRAGHVVARAVADGEQLWRCHVGGGIRGEMALNGGKAALWSDQTETVYAVDVASGALSWEFFVGDMPAAPIQAVGDAFLVAGKDNWIRLLRASDGEVTAETRWPDWLIDCRSVGPASTLVCLDITRTLARLDPVTLDVVRRLRMPARPRPGIVYLSEAPMSWGAADSTELMLDGILDGSLSRSASATRPAITVVDEDGYVYMIDQGPTP